MTAIVLGASTLMPVQCAALEPRRWPGSSQGGVIAPFPPPRPIELTPTADQPGKASIPIKNDGTTQSTCVRIFMERGGTILPSPPTESVGQCAIDDPITFQRIGLASGAHVDLDSAVTVRCSFALDLQAWARDDLAQIATQANSKLTKIIGVGGHACRSRNGVAGSPISEHASGNALDLTGLKFEDGRTITFADADATSRLQRHAIQKSACAHFTTVLGPGSDPSHKDHLHLDLRQRTHGYRICQWLIEQ